jgi:hypothetical protein
MKHRDDVTLFRLSNSGMGSFPDAGKMNEAGQNRTGLMSIARWCAPLATTTSYAA